MEWLQIIIILICSIILLIKEGLCENNNNAGMMCYNCNSYDDPRCGDPFDRDLFKAINCSDLKFLDEHGEKLLALENKTAPNLCRKQIQTVTLSGKTDYRIVRSCGYIAKNKRKFGEEEEEEVITTEDRCYKKPGTFEVMVHYCTCSKTGCNGVPDQFQKLNLLTIIGFSILTALFGSSVSNSISNLGLPVVIKY